MSQEEILSGANLNSADRKVAEAIQESGKPVSNEIRLSTGVILTARAANPNVLLRVMTKIPRPDPPTWIHPTMGREMPNADDPDYIKRVQSWEYEYSSAMTLAFVTLGTSLKSIPDEMSEGPQTPNAKWIQSYRLLGLPVFPENPDWRYQTWVMFIAAPTPADTKLIMETVGRLSGVKEADVRDVDNFPKGN